MKRFLILAVLSVSMSIKPAEDKAAGGAGGEFVGKAGQLSSHNEKRKKQIDEAVGLKCVNMINFSLSEGLREGKQNFNTSSIVLLSIVHQEAVEGQIGFAVCKSKVFCLKSSRGDCGDSGKSVFDRDSEINMTKTHISLLEERLRELGVEEGSKWTRHTRSRSAGPKI